MALAIEQSLKGGKLGMSGECLGTVTYDPEQDEVTKTGSRVILHGDANSETWGGVVIATWEKNVVVRAYAIEC